TNALFETGSAFRAGNSSLLMKASNSSPVMPSGSAAQVRHRYFFGITDHQSLAKVQTLVSCTSRARTAELVGPAGFEPATKGFTAAPGFPEEWTISSPSTSPAREWRATVRARDARSLSSRAIAGLRRSSQVVSAPSGRLRPAWLRVAIGIGRSGFPEFIPS